jgi:DNA polymerase III epsilon subunit-like protein
MKFIKDLLFFEIQTTGSDPEKDQILQLSAVLLDKDNLLEKNNFNSYVRVSYLDSVMLHHSKLLDVDVELIKRSQKVYDVIKNFHKRFDPKTLLLGSHSSLNFWFLKHAFKKAVVTFDYDSHMIQMWTLGYVYTLNYGLRKMPTFTTFLDHFGLKQKKSHDAMEKVRLEAEVFRRIIKEV